MRPTSRRFNRSNPSTAILASLVCLWAIGGSAEASKREPFTDSASRQHDPPTRDFDLEHILIDVRFDVGAGRVEGKTVQTFSVLRDGTSRLTLDAASDIDVQSVTIGEQRAEFHADGETLRIDLGRPHAHGASLTVAIAFAATPRKGLYFIRPDGGYPNKPTMLWTQGEMHEHHFWVPIWDYPNDRTRSETILEVPATWTAISNGELVATRDGARDGTRTFHWRQDIPHVTYLISIAAGEFEVARAESRSGVELAYWVPKGRTEEIDRSFGRTPAMVDFFEAWLDVPYPWAKYDQVVVYDFHFGGMENTSATTLTARTLHDERAHLDSPSDPLVAHELAHQWFGDLVTCSSWPHNWLNEGFATYLESLWFEHAHGQDELAYDVYRNAAKYHDQDRDEYRRPIVTDSYTDPMNLFDRHAYEKGAVVLHMLRDVLGDTDFQRGVRAYLKAHRETVVETDELRIALERATGRPLGWFFDQWVHKPGFPELAVESSHEAGQLALRVRQAQDTSDGTPIFRLPITVRLWDADGHRDHRLTVRGRDQVVYLASPEPPHGIMVDPGNRVLKTLTIDAPVGHLETQLTRSDAAIDRIDAVVRLAANGSPRAVTLAASALADDPFYGVRAEAAKALGKSRKSAAIKPLLGALEDTDSRVRTAAAKGLGDLGSAEASVRLARTLEEDSSYAARAAAAQALGKIGGSKAFDRLVKALRQDSHGDVVRASAFEGLAALGDERALAVAEKWASYGRPPKAREEAIDTLGELGSGDPRIRKLLERLIYEDRHIWARNSAIKALGVIGDDASTEVLERAAVGELDARVRREARKSLRKIRAKAARDRALRRDVDDVEQRLQRLEAQRDDPH